MTVTTTADHKLQEARDHTDRALKALDEILINHCWGHDELSEDRQALSKEARSLLQIVRNKLAH